jgi:uncharacterized repeat protein (TIGR04138 family)
MPGMAGIPLEEDVECANCGYNLRGLTTADNCPECGEPAMWTLRLVARRLYRRAMASQIAQPSGYSIDAVMFVNDVLEHAFTGSHAEGRRHTTASDVCHSFLAYAQAYFSDAAEAVGVLSEWKLHGSEDLGRIIWTMVEAGITQPSPGDTRDDFGGLFTMDDVRKAFA